VMFDHQFVTPGDVLRRGQEPDLTVVQDVLFIGGGMLGF